MYVCMYIYACIYMCEFVKGKKANNPPQIILLCSYMTGISDIVFSNFQREYSSNTANKYLRKM